MTKESSNGCHLPFSENPDLLPVDSVIKNFLRPQLRSRCFWCDLCIRAFVFDESVSNQLRAVSQRYQSKISAHLTFSENLSVDILVMM